MASNIDDKELARLEELAGRAKQGAFAEKNLCQSLGVDGYGHDNAAYLAAIGKYGPALVAEVRRLREEYAYEHAALIRHEQMVSDLMNQVKAWEWFNECRECMEWLSEVCWDRTPVCEAEHSFLAAERAVHADRE